MINQQLAEMFATNPIISIFLLLFEFSVFIILWHIIKPLFVMNKNITMSQKNTTVYAKKPIMTDSEYAFYLKLKSLEASYKVVSQLNLASIVTKLTNNNYYTDLFRNIDFAIFTPDYSEVLLLIELNDSTHQRKRRRKRDLKVQNICNAINVPLIKFYTKYPNDKEYVIHRVLEKIEKTKKMDS